ncbi:MAG: alanine racemase [Desulfuromonas sp.]|nr:MAG: alanine racemase [Desulfuromonas sp.]
MDFSPRPTCAEIDLQSLLHNLDQVHRFRKSHQSILAIVKADAYGHGAVPVSRTLAAGGVSQFGVATLEEAVELRQARLEQPLLVLGGCYPGQEDAFGALELMPAVGDLDSLQRLNGWFHDSGAKLKVHLKVDTGMGRIGFSPEELTALTPQLTAMTGLDVVGLMSHLACADEADDRISARQLTAFLDVRARLSACGIVPRQIHIGNSAGLIGWNHPDCTLLRPGIMLYGGMPGDKYRPQLDLRPVMCLRTRVAQLKTVPAETGLSYGHRFHTDRDSRIAVLPIGYADGYNRLLTNRGEVLIRGRRVPVVGTVCMDWILIDVTDVPDVLVGDAVTLLGGTEENCITAEEWGGWVDSISYEVFCRIGSRVPRRYLEAHRA